MAKLLIQYRPPHPTPPHTPFHLLTDGIRFIIFLPQVCIPYCSYVQSHFKLHMQSFSCTYMYLHRVSNCKIEYM